MQTRFSMLVCCLMWSLAGCEAPGAKATVAPPLGASTASDAIPPTIVGEWRGTSGKATSELYLWPSGKSLIIAREGRSEVGVWIDATHDSATRTLTLKIVSNNAGSGEPDRHLTYDPANSTLTGHTNEWASEIVFRRSSPSIPSRINELQR